jgi:hypothetical protein
VRVNPGLVGVVVGVGVVVVAVITVVASFPFDEAFAPQPTPIPARTIPFTDVNPYGADFLLDTEAEEWKIDKTLEMAHEAGIGWVKQQFPWEDLQLSPGPNGYWDNRLNQSTWDKYDRIVRLATKYHMQVIARLDRPPSWTRKDNRRPERPPDDFALYGDFVYDVVSHFKGRIHYYQIWNEPNIYPEWGDQRPDPAAYVQLLKIAYQRAKEADPNVVILSAPLAQTLENSSRNMSDIEFLREMYADGARPYFDILFANAYGFGLPPDDPPSPDRLNFQRVTLLRQIMEENGDSNKPVWFNEFGWDAAPANFAADKLPWGRVSDQQQAQYTVDAIQFARTHWPWAGVFNIWYFRQPGDLPSMTPDQAAYYFRMVDVTFTPRPIYNAVKQATQGLDVVGPGTYAVTDPSAQFSGQWEPVLQPSTMGGVVESSTTEGDSLTITFQGGGLSLDFQRAPNVGQVYLTVDGREANAVPNHFQGRSVLDLSADNHQEAPIEIPIADGLSRGQHVVRLVVGPASGSEREPVQITGFEVRPIDTSAALRRGGIIIGAALAIGSLAVLIGHFWPWRQ